MALSVQRVTSAVIVRVSAPHSATEVEDALRAAAVDAPFEDLVLDLVALTPIGAVEVLVREWGPRRVAYVVRGDREADAIESGARRLDCTMRVCATVEEALRWLARASAAALDAPAAPQGPKVTISETKPVLPWGRRAPSQALLASAVSLLRALAEERGEDPPSVDPPATAAHLEAFARVAGSVPDDVRRVLGFSTGFWTRDGDLRLDFLSDPPHALDADGLGLWVVGGSAGTEGLVLAIDASECRLWWVEHDGIPLTLVERGVDAWLLRCAAVALERFHQRVDVEERLRLGLDVTPGESRAAWAPQHRLDPQPVALVRRTVDAASREGAWLDALPDTARVFDFRQAAPRTQANIAYWSEGDWSRCGVLWAVV